MKNEVREYMKRLSAECNSDFDIHNTMSASTFFDEDGEPNLQELYIAHFRRIPNAIHMRGICYGKANEWFRKTYQDKITDYHYKICSYDKRNSFVDYFCYALFEDLLICLGASAVNLVFRKTDRALVDEIVAKIKKFNRRQPTKPNISLLVANSYGLDTKAMEISKPKLAIEENYNDDFLPIHETILSRLQKKNDKGLVLLHGKPGTGKTSYIRYLMTKVKKDVIFLPPNMATSITDPGLMNVLIDNPNSIFVIEDAESIIIDRNQRGSSSVSALLNLADGLLSDCLNIQIICSFNTDLSRVDSALMRKGRLIAKYEFAELEAHKAQALSNMLGFSSVISSPMTLAAVYNQNAAEFTVSSYKKMIGF